MEAESPVSQGRSDHTSVVGMVGVQDEADRSLSHDGGSVPQSDMAAQRDSLCPPPDSHATDWQATFTAVVIKN
jgi:hypothetical protein